MLAFLLLAGSAGAQGSASATSGSVGYTAEVPCSQNTIIDATNGNFGTILQGMSSSLIPSVYLSNDGCTDAKVEARFDTSFNDLFGLITTTNYVLGAYNLTMGTAEGMTNLMNDGNNVLLVTTVPAHGSKDLNATLFVPSTQEPGIYTGTVILTFSEYREGFIFFSGYPILCSGKP